MNIAKKLVLYIIDTILAKFIRFVKARTVVPPDPYHIVWSRAAESSADYIQTKLHSALLFQTREQLWDFAMKNARGDGLQIEFGVFNGYSINYFAKTVKTKPIFGFDSFEGLKEDWFGNCLPQGSFNLKGNLPKVLPNVTLVKGWFDVTVPKFLAEHPDTMSFIHLDADTYESTTLVLSLIKDRIAENTVIIFDEYLGFPNWGNGEFRAWQEFASEARINYRYLGFAPQQAAIQIL